MAKVKKVTITLDDKVEQNQVDQMVEFLATWFDEFGFSYAIEYSEEDCPDETP